LGGTVGLVATEETRAEQERILVAVAVAEEEMVEVEEQLFVHMLKKTILLFYKQQEEQEVQEEQEEVKVELLVLVLMAQLAQLVQQVQYLNLTYLGKV
jgi:hypothetical protein